MARGSLIAVSGLFAGLAAVAALTVSAERRNESPWRPINATSHWIHGRRAGSQSRLDLAHTGTGFVTHMLASLWWALPFSAMVGRSARPSPQ
ncbi:hypothetical protein CN109_18130, partial [Sinorhizobium meliloti]